MKKRTAEINIKMLKSSLDFQRRMDIENRKRKRNKELPIKAKKGKK